MKLLIVGGTRPEAIKLAPILRTSKFSEKTGHFCWTNQHSRDSMSRDFWSIYGDQRQPDRFIEWSHADLSLNVDRISRIIRDDQITMVLVQGDTNSALAGAIAAKESKCSLIHLEAGLRCHENIIEERNRIAIDKIASIHLCTSKLAYYNLLEERLGSIVRVVGQTGLETLDHVIGMNKETPILTQELREKNEPLGLITLHRRELLSNQELLKSVCATIAKTATDRKMNFIFVGHPSFMAASLGLGIMEDFINCGRVHVIPEQSYEDMVSYLEGVNFIITDSGGLTEDAYHLRTPGVILRRTTERPEGAMEGLFSIIPPEQYMALPYLKWKRDILDVVEHHAYEMDKHAYIAPSAIDHRLRRAPSDLVWDAIRNYL